VRSSAAALRLSGVLCALAGAVMFAGKAIVVKLLYLYPGMSAEISLALRMSVALPFFLCLSLWAQRNDRHEALLPGDGWKIALIGFMGYYLASYFDFLGLRYITATLERLILYISPTVVLLLSVLVRKTRVTQQQMIALAIIYCGVGVAFVHDFIQNPKMSLGSTQVTLGALLVLGSAVSYAFFLFGSGELVKRVGALRLTALAGLVASVCCIVQYFILQPISHWHAILEFPQAVYELAFINGTLCTVIPIFFIMIGISRLGAPIAAQIGMIGPIATIVLSTIFLHEQLSAWQISGTILVIVGVFMATQVSSNEITA